MYGRLASLTLALVMTGYLMIVGFGYNTHKDIQTQVNEKVTNVVEIASTLGMLTENMYDELSDYINRYSIGSYGNRYFIQLKLEKQIKPNIYDVFYESSEDRENDTVRKGQIVGRPLDVGDKLTVYVEDRTPTLFGRVITAPVLTFVFSDNEKYIRSSKTAIIGKRYPDTVTGYDVIADLNTNPFDYVNEIIVITKVNSSGKSYSTAASLPSYKTYSITNASDPDYIFPDGEFIRDEDVIDGERIVHYIQRY